MKPTNLEQPVFNRIGKSVFTRAVLGEWQRIGVDIQVRFLDALLERYIGAANRSMEVEDVERKWAQGRNIRFDESITLALAD